MPGIIQSVLYGLTHKLFRTIPPKQVLLLSIFYRWGNQSQSVETSTESEGEREPVAAGTMCETRQEWLSNLPKDTHTAGKWQSRNSISKVPGSLGLKPILSATVLLSLLFSALIPLECD